MKRLQKSSPDNRAMIKKISQRLFSTQFLSLVLIKMLIPAMATGGVAVEIGAIEQVQPVYADTITAAELSTGEAVEVFISGINENSEILVREHRPTTAGTFSVTTISKNLSLSPEVVTSPFNEQTQPQIKLPDLIFT
jgi:hypothetical protein